MNDANPVQLGKQFSGTVSQDTFTGEVNDPTPIVLWSKGTAAAVLYYAQKTNAMLGTFTQTIDKLAGGQGKGPGLKAMFDDYPITFKGKAREKEDERTLNAIEPDQIYTADIDGDGVQEMVLVRRIGEVCVYNTQKRLFHKALPSARPDLYAYSVQSAHKVALPGKDVLFLAVNRRSYADSSHFSAADQAFDRHSANVTVLRVDSQGIEPLALADPGWRIEEVFALGVVNKPGSTAIDELVVCSRRQEDQAICLSRHTPGGALVDQAREVYAQVASPEGLSFAPLLQSKQLLAFNAVSRVLYFVRPDKKVNWIRRVDLARHLGQAREIYFLAPFQYGDTLLAAVRHRHDVYVIDEEGRFYVWKERMLAAQQQVRAALRLPAESPLHVLVDVRPAGTESVRFLATQSRTPQTRALSDEELEQAAGRFLAEQALADCQKNKQPRYSPPVANLAASFCEKRNMPCPEIASMEDIRTKLPEFYQEVKSWAQESYRDCLEVELLFSLEHEGPRPGEIDASGMKNPAAYKDWLKGLYLGGEIVFSIVDLRGAVVSRKVVSGFHKGDAPTNLGLPAVAYGQDQERHTVVTSLEAKPMGRPAASHYYLITW